MKTAETAQALANYIMDNAARARSQAAFDALVGLAQVVRTGRSKTAALAANQAYKILTLHDCGSFALQELMDDYTSEHGEASSWIEVGNLVGYDGELYTVSRTDGGRTFNLHGLGSAHNIRFKHQPGKKFLVVA
jgi:hypothetical protein